MLLSVCCDKHELMTGDATIIPLVVCMGQFDIESLSMVIDNSALMTLLSHLLVDDCFGHLLQEAVNAAHLDQAFFHRNPQLKYLIVPRFTSNRTLCEKR
jgi:hypothetical protein